MPQLVTPSNDIKVKNAKPQDQDKPYKLSDGGGLHLLVNPDGNKYWHWMFLQALKRIGLVDEMTGLGFRAFTRDLCLVSTVVYSFSWLVPPGRNGCSRSQLARAQTANSA